MGAVAAFCLMSSAIYLINDVVDCEADRAHPAKSRRPVASGRLSPLAAVLGAIALAALAALFVWRVEASENAPDQPFGGMGLAVWAAAFFALSLLYCFWLKNHVIIDVIVLSMGFVLRAMAGAAAIAVPISPWLVVCTFTLCLFIALAKRRSEVVELAPDQAAATRKVNRGYDGAILEHMLTVSTAMAILTYCLYCLAGRTVRSIGSAHMVWTIPLVVYGLFRYNMVTRQCGRNDPVTVVLHDKVLWLVLVIYVVMSGLIIKFGATSWMVNVLDVEWLSK